MKKFSKSHHSTMNELNITPLLDLAFVLLVIFIISTAPMVNDLDLNLPSKNKSQQKPASVPKLNFVIVEADGKVFLNYNQVEIPALLPQFQRLKRADKDVTVMVHGDSAVMYQVMVSVFDALQQANIEKVGLAPDRPSKELMDKALMN